VPIENIDEIFGKAKFEQVEMDISGSFGLARALVDGTVQGETSKDAMTLAIKGVIAEVQYAREQIEDWLYEEYAQIAGAYDFDRYPKIRWDDFLLKDELAHKTLVQGLVDRRIISYETAFKLLGFDPEQEKSLLKQEAPEVQKGWYGLSGSPYQQSKENFKLDKQTNQGTPSGTPSEGRPKSASPKVPSESTPKGKIKEIIKKPKKEVKKQFVKQAAKVAPEAIEYFVDKGISFAPAKAANAGGVAVSNFEMSQNAAMQRWSAEKIDRKLKETMEYICDEVAQTAKEYGVENNFVVGANIAAFIKVANAMIVEGI
jgi:hypothetical protein